MVIEGFSTLPSDEDPQEFTNSSTPNRSVTLNNSAAVPSLSLAAPSGMGPFARFILRALQATGSATRRYADLSGVYYGRAS